MLDPDLTAALFLVAFVLAVVVLFQTAARSVLGWSVAVATFVLTWNAASAAGWI